MKREFAATIFSILLAGTALAQTIESSDLPPPAQNETPDRAQLRGLIDRTLNQRHTTQPAQNHVQEDWNTNSSAELWLEGIPEHQEIPLDSLALKAKRDANARVVTQDPTLPTTLGWNRGNWKANVGTNVTTTTTTTVVPTDIYAGTLPNSGGTGVINGRLEYDLNSWQFYGGTKREVVANADGTLGVNHNFSGGTFYNLPPAVLGGKVGTGFEVNPVGDAKTRLEYRQVFGNTEGFLAAERTTPFQHTPTEVNPVNGLKAGINRKF